MEAYKLEEVISKVIGVMHVKVIVVDEALQEVHIVANSKRAPKQIVRDIESSLVAIHDYKIDRKVISIAQVDTEEMGIAGRIKYEGIRVETTGNYVACRVSLSYKGDTYQTTKTCLKVPTKRYKAIAEATICCINDIVGADFLFDVQEVAVQKNTERTIVTAVVTMFDEKQQESVLVGAVLAYEELDEAVVKATLDAINRQIASA